MLRISEIEAVIKLEKSLGLSELHQPEFGRPQIDSEIEAGCKKFNASSGKVLNEPPNQEEKHE